MRVRLISVASALVAFGLVGAVSGATLLYDDFEGSALTPGMWPTTMSSGSTVSVRDSVLTLATTTGSWPYVNVYSSSAYETGTVTFKLGPADMVGAVNFGFHVGPGEGGVGIEIGNDRGGWKLWASDGTNTYLSNALTAAKASDTWTIVRAIDSIKVYDNGNLLATDTTVLPTGAQRVHMSVYTGDGVSSAGFDSVTVSSTLPEPSMGALLFCGLVSLVAYAWRNHK